MTSRSLRVTLNWAPIMPRSMRLFAADVIFFQSRVIVSILNYALSCSLWTTCNKTGSMGWWLIPLTLFSVRRWGLRREVEEREVRQELRRQARTLPQVQLGQGCRKKRDLNTIIMQPSHTTNFHWTILTRNKKIILFSSITEDRK